MLELPERWTFGFLSSSISGFQKQAECVLVISMEVRSTG